MIIQAGDIGVEIDTGNNTGTLQRLEAGEWTDYLVDGELDEWPVKADTLPPGRYRVHNE